MISTNKSLGSIEPFYFRHPFTCMLAGPAQSGKTTLISKIISQARVGLSRPGPTSIIYCYSQWQEIYDEIKKGRGFAPSFFDAPSIFFNRGLPDVESIDVTQNTLIILDDLMQEAGNNSDILNIFTTDSHQKNFEYHFCDTQYILKLKTF